MAVDDLGRCSGSTASRVQPILDGVRWEPNAPEAEFAANDAGFACLVLRAHPDDSDQRAVVIYWTGVSTGSFGEPNDEGIGSHPLSGDGLERVHWAGEIQAATENMRRFVVLTKEGVAEVCARGIGTMRLQQETTASDALRSIPWPDAATGQAGPQRIQVAAYTDQGNYAVIRLPQRKFPGVVFQGDSLSAMLADARDLATAAQRPGPDAAQLATDLVGQLEEIVERYERALASHGHELPYRPE